MRSALQTLCFEADLIDWHCQDAGRVLVLHLQHAWRLFEQDMLPWPGQCTLRFWPIRQLHIERDARWDGSALGPANIDALHLQRVGQWHEATLSLSGFQRFDFVFQTHEVLEASPNARAAGPAGAMDDPQTSTQYQSMSS